MQILAYFSDSTNLVCRVTHTQVWPGIPKQLVSILSIHLKHELLDMRSSLFYTLQLTNL